MAEWGYDCRTFDSFDELQEAMPTVAKELADNYDTDDLVSIWVFPDAGEYAVYEVVDGWYADYGLGSDSNGAPDLLQFLDFDELGDALIATWDDSCHYQTSDGSIVTFD